MSKLSVFTDEATLQARSDHEPQSINDSNGQQLVTITAPDTFVGIKLYKFPGTTFQKFDTEAIFGSGTHKGSVINTLKLEYCPQTSSSFYSDTISIMLHPTRNENYALMTKA